MTRSIKPLANWSKYRFLVDLIQWSERFIAKYLHLQSVLFRKISIGAIYKVLRRFECDAAECLADWIKYWSFGESCNDINKRDINLSLVLFGRGFMLMSFVRFCNILLAVQFNIGLLIFLMMILMIYLMKKEVGVWRI